MAILQVSSAAELTAALSSAQGGDRIELALSNYGDVDIGGNFTSDVTIVSADPDNLAIFTGMDLVGTHIVLDAIKFEYSGSPGANDIFSPFDIDNSSFITVRNSVFTGARIINGQYGSGTGLAVRNSNHIVIEYNEFSYWFKALGIHSVTDAVVLGNDFHSNNNDGINFTQVNGLLIEGNWIRDFLTAPDQHHNDMIQMWNGLGFRRSQNITIRGNFMDAGTGRGVDGIFINNEAISRQGGSFEEYAYHNILIENNIIFTSHGNGIDVGHTDGLGINNNTLLYDTHTTSGPNWVPEIRTPGGEPILGQSLNVTIEDNITGPASDGNNFVAQHTNPNGTNYYGDLFVNVLGAEAPGLADIRAVPGGVIETGGFGALMTREDIPLVVGPGSVAPDPVPEPEPEPDPVPEPGPALQEVLDDLQEQITLNLDALTKLGVRVTVGETKQAEDEAKQAAARAAWAGD